MKKRISSLILTLCMVFSMLPVTALAGGDSSVVHARNYTELVNALKNTKVRTLYIDATHVVMDGNQFVMDENGNYVLAPFDWEGQTVLDLTSDHLPYVCVGGDWTVPEEVTVNHDTSLVFADQYSSITINGTWNNVSNDARIAAGDNDIILNGTMKLPSSKTRLKPIENGMFYLNGRMEVFGGTVCNVYDITMGNGAVIATIPPDENSSAKSALTLLGGHSIVGPAKGSAVIESQFQFSGGTVNVDTSTLGGNIEISKILLPYNEDKLLIAEDAHIKTVELACNEETSLLEINGTLELNADRAYHNFGTDGTMTIGENGTLVLRPRNYLNYADSTAAISGTGTIKLYATSDSDGSFNPYTRAKIFEETDERPAQVADSITIWRSWSCTHTWKNVSTQQSTTTVEGLRTDTCTECGDTRTITIPCIPAKPHKIVNTVSGAHVYWTAVDGAEKYGVWRSETGKDGTYKWLGNPTVPHFTDTTAVSGKTYYYKVTSMSGGSHTNKSEAIGITYVATPDITSRSNVAAGIKLGWNKITGATGYAIYRKSYDGTDAWSRVATISGNSTFTWTDTSVKNNNGEIYKYTIRALTGAKMNTLSGCRNAGRTMVRLSSQVLKSAAAASATSIKCSWTTSSRVTGYEVRFMVDGEVYKTFTIGAYKTGVKTFTGLKAGQTYDVQVRTYKKVDDVGSFYSDWSTAKNVTL